MIFSEDYLQAFGIYAQVTQHATHYKLPHLLMHAFTTA